MDRREIRNAATNRWHLRELMARSGMYSTTDLRPLLADRGILLSPSQVYRLVTEPPERLSVKTLLALLDILGCTMEQLIEPVEAGTQLRRTISSGGGQSAGLGDHRPRRALILPLDRKDG